MSKIVPVILSGGSGTRLWPLSREKTPKQFLKLMDELTLLQKTVKRTQGIFCNDNIEIVTVTLKGMYDETVRQLNEISPSLSRHILLEPEARNTAAAVALAICYVEATFGEDALIWLLPADHYIGNEAMLREALFSAREVAADDYLVTFGIVPTRPEVGYGYICKGERLEKTESYKVRNFFEKPNLEVATGFVNSGEYLWSSGMHLFRAKTGRDNFMRLSPQTWELVKTATAKTGSLKQPSKILYAQVHKEPFETAVIEKTDRLAVIPCDPEWSDIGCWESLWEIRSKDEKGNVLSGSVFYEDTENSMILAEDRLVTCVGLKDIIIIETQDSILVADKKSNGSLKALVQRLQVKKREETVDSRAVHHEWGRSGIIADAHDTTVSELTIKSGSTMYGESKSQNAYLVVVSGKGDLVVNGLRRHIGQGDTINMRQDSVYSIYNLDSQALKLCYLQLRQSAMEIIENAPAPLPWGVVQENVLAAE